MKENGSFLRDYLLGHGGTSEVSPELKATMNRNSESVALPEFVKNFETPAGIFY
jgi:hypothetical protein